jgi:hypothetical protein
MITRKEISDFAAFCYKRYNLEIPPVIIKDYIQTISPIKQPVSNNKTINSHYKVKECSSNNVSCSHVSFDSVRCDSCEYYNISSPSLGNFK